MKIGLQIPDFTGPGEARLGADLATVARTADDAGFEFIAVMDHFFQIGAVDRPSRTCSRPTRRSVTWPALTSRAKLLTLVTGAVYRHPGILAKIVSTLDVLSGGRAWLGIGAAWNEEESRAWASRSRRSPSGSSGWRRRCRSACRCGAATNPPTRARITSWNGR